MITINNVNSVDDNNSNDIPVPMDCEHAWLCISYWYGDIIPDINWS
jgi:hypothetical protein